MTRSSRSRFRLSLGALLTLAGYGLAAPPITWQCGNEGETPCDSETDFFWDNGNLFCDRGLKATGFRVLPDITFKAYDWVNLNKADMTKAVKLITVDLPELQERLNNLDQDDFLSPVCLGTVQGGDCWTTPPIPGTSGTWITRCYADSAGVVPGIVIGNDCWATPPTPDVKGHETCVPVLGCSCAPALPGQSLNCTLIPGIPGTSGHWITRCFADPAGVVPGIEQGGQCWATPPIPGVPGAVVPIPDFGKPGWHVPEDIFTFLANAADVLAMFPPAIQGIPGGVPQLNWDPSDFSVDPNIFNLTDFQAQLAALKAFFNQPFFTLFPDLISDFTDPPGTCVNDTRRQAAAAAFQGQWNYWALTDQRELAADEPINWVVTIGGHNAFNNAADGYIAPNQRYSVTDLLNFGIRYLALDLHWFNNQLRLCHGQANHSGCGTLDRYYSNVIKEIRNWVDAHPSEVVWISFEDRSDGADNYVDEPIAEFLGSRVYRPDDPFGLPARKQGGAIDEKSRWPTLQELRDLGKQVIISGNVAHPGGWIWTGIPGDSFSASRAKNFHVDDRYLLSWAEDPSDNPPVPEYLSPIDDQGRFNLGANSLDQYETRSFLDPFDASGYITAQGMLDRVRTNVNRIHLDLVQAQEDTSQCPGAGPDVCDPPDRRLEMAVWSWKPGEPAGTQQGEIAALLDGADGRRWESANPAELHVFACARRRAGEAACWSDRAGQHWRITAAAGDWTQGCAECYNEFGPGWVFAAPVNGWQAERLRETVQAYGQDHGGADVDVWLRHKVGNFPVAFTDCNRNGLPDDCDITSGISRDVDQNQVPDECTSSFPSVSSAATVAGVFVDQCFADAAHTTPGVVEGNRCWNVPPSQATPIAEQCFPVIGCICPGVRFEGQCYLIPPVPGFAAQGCFADAQMSAPGLVVDGACYAAPLGNTTGVNSSIFSNAPDDVYSGIGGQWVMYDLGSSPAANGSGPDFNVYEVDFGVAEFGSVDVLVSPDGIHFASVKNTEGPVVRISGDEIHGNDAYARSYDLAPSGFSQVRYIAINGNGNAAAGPQVGFDLDAIGVIHHAKAPVWCDLQADFDQDGDVDLTDADLFAACSSGATVPAPLSCEGKDFDFDGDVDQVDYGAFQRCVSGTNILPDPNCLD